MITLYSASLDGHRAAYVDFVGRLFDDQVQVNPEKLVGQPDPVLFLMIEENFFLFVRVALARALLRRRTVGLLFRPKPALEGVNLRLRLKRAILKVLKPLAAIRVITIVPHYVSSRFDTISDGWIYDFQFWDMDARDHALFGAPDAGAAADLHQAVVAARKGRETVSAIGGQTREKGFDILAEVCANQAELHERFQFVAAGRVAPDLSAQAQSFARDGQLYDRFVTDEEILALYSASSAVWCFYAADYDQASGIAGRALQFGIPPILRKGSIMETIFVKEGLPHLAVERPEALVSATLPPRAGTMAQDVVQRMRDASLATLRQALWG